MKYKVFSIQTKGVCVPSDDYYADGNDWQTDYLPFLNSNEELFDSVEEAAEYVKNNYSKGEYAILPVVVVQ